LFALCGGRHQHDLGATLFFFTQAVDFMPRRRYCSILVGASLDALHEKWTGRHAFRFLGVEFASLVAVGTGQGFYEGKVDMFKVTDGGSQLVRIIAAGL
jgi:hypothetical protein